MKMMFTKGLLFIAMLLLVFVSGFRPASGIFLSKTGYVKFVSEAPLEQIEAENNRVGVVLDVAKKSIAIQVPIIGFDGFNSALQHEHFNENYMEVERYPQAKFTGKIIEEVDLNVLGTYKVRAKGMLDIHGAQKERIVSGQITVKDGLISIRSNFEISLADHDIIIPKIVNQKIAEVIEIEVKADLKPQS